MTPVKMQPAFQALQFTILHLVLGASFALLAIIVLGLL